MIFVLDEGVSRQVADTLRDRGHEVICVWETPPSIADEAILAIANEREALVVTQDKDFGELVYRQRLATAGVVLLRLAGLSQSKRAELVGTAVERHGASLKEAFTVVTPGLVRVRRRL